MADPASDLGELHVLHQRAKAIRDRLVSGPKTLAARGKILETRQAAFEKARKALKDARAHNKNREVQLQQVEAKIEEWKVKLNQAKKQTDYDGIRNQIANENNLKSKLEVEILETMETLEQQAADLAKQEAEVAGLDNEVKKLAENLRSQSGPDQALLSELEAAIVASEVIIPIDQRDQYRRVVKQRAADAMASLDEGACTGCYVAVTAQMMNELINRHSLVFCNSCGRVVYLIEQDRKQPRSSTA